MARIGARSADRLAAARGERRIRPDERPAGGFPRALAILPALGAGLWLLLQPVASEAPSGKAAERPDFAEQIRAVLNQPRYRHASWGALAVSLDSRRILFAHQEDRLFIPASNVKLFTAALALETLGPSFRIRTPLCASGPLEEGRLRGDLIIQGRGDPSWTPYFARSADPKKVLAPIVEAIRKAGVRVIEGDLVADLSFFASPPYGSGWEWDDFSHSYAAPASPVSFFDNALTLILSPGAKPGAPARAQCEPNPPRLPIRLAVRTLPRQARGGVYAVEPMDQDECLAAGGLPIGAPPKRFRLAVKRPALWFLRHLKAALEAAGVSCQGGLRTKFRPGNGAAKCRELGATASPPLSEILRRTLCESHNLTAQLLFLQVGAAQEKPETENRRLSEPLQALRRFSADIPGATEALAREAMRAFLKRIGVRPGEAQIEEGTGLSRRNLASPAATVKLLAYAAGRPYGSVFRRALPLAGREGTLAARLRGGPAEGRCRAKTGSLRHARALSGYLQTRAGERVAFSIYLNGFVNDGGPSPVRDIDRIVALLCQAP
ncbi:MAG: D-alanyl-D-alanine carboxypeptidase/D-alanyl-D-alanine-endopeptidase [Verrucomicrobia bacterium]|nr:D-alanyl-D-alanine carboxypeptidase/D-alanyl-D-alanine-endopeptidase [Verrucomicrobiota bacterium]